MTATLNDLRIEYVGVETLRPDPNNARTHSKKQIRQIARSIEEFGFVNGILVDDSLQVIAGHGRLLAAKLLGMDTVPIVRLTHLTPKQRRAYVRFFACAEDLSHDSPDTPLPEAVACGTEPFLVIGAIAGG